jgi:hypothetical protein
LAADEHTQAKQQANELLCWRYVQGIACVYGGGTQLIDSVKSLFEKAIELFLSNILIVAPAARIIQCVGGLLRIIILASTYEPERATH